MPAPAAMPTAHSKMKRVHNRKKGRKFSGSTLRIAQRILEGRPRTNKRRSKNGDTRKSIELV
jgi:hypothetical protein